MQRTAISHGWALSHTAGPRSSSVGSLRDIPATVPGTVHTDLLAAGIIEDPYLDGNEALQAWIAQSDWRYTTSFEWEPGDERSELVFEGLDTVAAVALNGHPVLHAENMHRTHRVDATAHLVPGTNHLAVEFSSAIREADRRSLDLGSRPHANHHPYNALRKMACSFGWDWGIDTATAGIWKPVYLEQWSTARLASVRPVATVDGADGVVDIHLELARASGEGPLVATAAIGGATARTVLSPGTSSAVLSVRLPSVNLWWPRGYGDQALYRLDVEIGPADGRTAVALDSWSRDIGFRTVDLAMPEDGGGTGFGLEVNGRPVFVKGANWIPDDAFPHRVDRARYARRIGQAAAAGLNLLRVWGGGIYESEDFYSLCDEHGILTWQDFLLACAAYSEEEPLRSEIEAEAREAVARLAVHPSLAVLNGNNENLWGYTDWDWQALLEGRSWGRDYYCTVLPGIAAELAPHVVYTPGSPFTPAASGFDPQTDPNDPSRGTMHIWDLWNQKDYLHYRDYRPRFVAEFGWQGPPAWSTLTRALSDDPLTPESPGMLSHQKAADGNTKLVRGLVPHLPLPHEMHDWHWAMQLNQANAVRTGIEWFRSLAPHCTGSIVWQLNDCWPVTSWAAIDGNGHPKPLYAALRAANADRLLTIQPTDPASTRSPLEADAVNDTDQAWEGELRIERRTLSGRVLSDVAVGLRVPPRSVVRTPLPEDLSLPEDPASEMLVAVLAGTRTFWHFAEYRGQALDAAEFLAEAEPCDGGILLRITARTLLRDVTVLADKLDADATVDPALVTLLPAESAEFRIRTALPLTLSELSDRRVLRSANQLVSHGAEVPVPADELDQG
ncbi:beta-mannosidase [Sinomonas atrocyanea]|uniref:beta-mannosidase n=1 Tax=Sinomonas atrocyanea TaxID=37927 RepID=A0A127A5D1_9MICC|nr:glycoside hydrolase family 2 protein [Sinomonas atrocyanea]AMM34649.1 beta-mannosidase [Sinomonas atrocyanea]GEB63127.1 beta-mannosidase [Sinomonas atrocyanea]GGG67210.1 beta-mannosidase [Sinomonas atrocyanea]